MSHIMMNYRHEDKKAEIDSKFKLIKDVLIQSTNIECFQTEYGGNALIIIHHTNMYILYR